MHSMKIKDSTHFTTGTPSGTPCKNDSLKTNISRPVTNVVSTSALKALKKAKRKGKKCLVFGFERINDQKTTYCRYPYPSPQRGKFGQVDVLQ